MARSQSFSFLTNAVATIGVELDLDLEKAMEGPMAQSEQGHREQPVNSRE
jgi:hypothetical protein